MLYKHRNILLITFLGIAFIGIVASVKIMNLPNHRQTAAAADTASKPEQVATDGGFYAQPAKADYKVMDVPRDTVLADAYLVGDVVTGKIYLQKNIEVVLPFASMSKLVTAIVASQTYKPSDIITITKENTEVPSDETGIHEGEKFTANELLYPLLLASSNISGEALAAGKNRIKFLESMSSFAWEIGMPKSYFADPTGLSEHNAGTAKGFFALARYIYENRQDLLGITRTAYQTMATTTDHDSHKLVNIHPFVNDPRFLGGKTGHTVYAQDTMLTIMKLHDRPIAIIVLHSPDKRKEDTNILINKVEDLLAEGN